MTRQLVGPDDELLTPTETASRLRVTLRQLHRMAESGRVPSVLLPRGRRQVRRYRQSVVDTLAPAESPAVCERAWAEVVKALGDPTGDTR